MLRKAIARVSGRVAGPSATRRIPGHHVWNAARLAPAPSFAGVAAGLTAVACFANSAQSAPGVNLKLDAAEAEELKKVNVARQRRELYPSIEPFNKGMLRVSDVHEIYFEESGNPNGKPVVFVHGGPGGGTTPKYRSFFDPAVYRIVLFDQRGSGHSTPHACLEDNTTWTLVADMEKLRQELNIDKWQVFGGSWGSTLGLTYAICHPARVTEIVLRGIFMLRRHELEWYYQAGASYIFPDQWEKYRDEIPVPERGDFIEAYHKRLTGDDEVAKLSAARAWTTWESCTSTLLPDPVKAAKGEDEQFALAFARIENHFFWNKGFFPSDSWILENVYKIRHIPTVIVQGRFDVVCPAKSAWDLHRAFPEAELKLVEDSGHSCFEPGTQSELLKATDQFRARK
jgi:proline iminopeptidase